MWNIGEGGVWDDCRVCFVCGEAHTMERSMFFLLLLLYLIISSC